MEYYYPKHLQVEVVAGICTASCIMCAYKNINRKGILQNERFAEILEKFKPYKNHLLYTTLHGMGEPLLDKRLPEKIEAARIKNFPSVGFATNATELDCDLSLDLLTAGLNTIIFSVDGTIKQTHELIRRGTDFDKVVNNILNFIKIRNKKFKAKVIVRMIRQEANIREVDDFQSIWSSRLNSSFGDMVSFFDVHNYGDEDHILKKYSFQSPHPEEIDRSKCSDLMGRFFVLIDGTVALCCADEHGTYNAGNIFHDDPVAIFNGERFRHYRSKMLSGELHTLSPCKGCHILLSRNKSVYNSV